MTESEPTAEHSFDHSVQLAVRASRCYLGVTFKQIFSHGYHHGTEDSSQTQGPGSALGGETKQSPHSLVIAAVEREVDRADRMRAFIREAQTADQAIDEGASVFAAEDVHAWMATLVRNPKAARPKFRRSMQSTRLSVLCATE